MNYFETNVDFEGDLIFKLELIYVFVR